MGQINDMDEYTAMVILKDTIGNFDRWRGAIPTSELTLVFKAMDVGAKALAMRLRQTPDVDDNDNFTCATCGEPVIADWRYCPECGQRLDWYKHGHF